MLVVFYIKLSWFVSELPENLKRGGLVKVLTISGCGMCLNYL